MNTQQKPQLNSKLAAVIGALVHVVGAVVVFTSATPVLNDAAPKTKPASIPPDAKLLRDFIEAFKANSQQALADVTKKIKADKMTSTSTEALIHPSAESVYMRHPNLSPPPSKLPNNVSDRFQAAKIANSKEIKEEFLKSLTKSEHPWVRYRAFLELGRAAIIYENVEAAKTFADQARKALWSYHTVDNEISSDLFALEGAISFRRGQLEIALLHYDQALENDPWHFHARVQRLDLLIKLGKNDRALLLDGRYCIEKVSIIIYEMNKIVALTSHPWQFFFLRKAILPLTYDNNILALAGYAYASLLSDDTAAGQVAFGNLLSLRKLMLPEDCRSYLSYLAEEVPVGQRRRRGVE
jgi:tetratricopeptide (TPR) repeat protein